MSKRLMDSRLALPALLVMGCATIPDGRYGVAAFDVEGMEQLDPRALHACLVTRERDAVEVGPAAFGDRSCGEPPFADERGALELWSWPWSAWPVFDRGVFDLDLERIQRWFQARGYYDTRIVDITYEPEAARFSDRTEDLSAEACPDADDGCRLWIHVAVDEGLPVLVEEVELRGIQRLASRMEERLRAALLVRPGERFDEHFYERSKARLKEALGEASFAQAEVTGRVWLDREARTARVVFDVEPGPPSVFGDVRVQGEQDLPADVIIAAANLEAGERYSESALIEAQSAIYALGAFSSVNIEPEPIAGSEVVPLRVEVRPLRRQRFRAGVGITSGVMQRVITEPVQSVPQWDVHLLLGYEHRNLFGGMRRFEIEDRPRLIFPAQFPRVSSTELDRGPRPGNLLTTHFEQPSFLEARTTLFSDGLWDYGPDPFFGFFRHDLSINLGLRRSFFSQRLTVWAAVQHEFYDVDEADAEALDVESPLASSDYVLPYLSEQVVLDLRDDARRPTRGALFSLGAQQAFRLGYATWRYLRLTPDASGYLPLPFGMVLAARFAVGFLFILDSADLGDGVDAQLTEALGPFPHRLRGGGANGVRGFQAGELGVGRIGGKGSWLSSLELRVPVMSQLSLALFTDVGDVSFQPALRFSHLNTSVGFGFRYLTLVGPIRLDLAWRVPGAQVVGSGRPEDPAELSVLPSAFHVTIGEPF